MQQTEITIPDTYVSRLNINGLRGRVLDIPSKRPSKHGKNILLVYGHHSSIERMYSLASYLSIYGTVTMPDLPGFGGMDSFYIINKKPTLDAMAEYLATFIKLHYRNKPIAICGMSYGFLVVTRMLQKYPHMHKQVNLLVSLVGFSKKNDFRFKPATYNTLLYGSRFMSTLPFSFLAKHLFFTKPLIKASYAITAKSHVKMMDATPEERQKRIDFEVYLWKCNDARTYFATSLCFLTVNLTTQKIPLALHHVSVKQDQYFDKAIVLKNLRRIYSKVSAYTASLPNHAPTVISDEADAALLIPQRLKVLLKQYQKSKV